MWHRGPKEHHLCSIVTGVFGFLILLGSSVDLCLNRERQSTDQGPELDVEISKPRRSVSWAETLDETVPLLRKPAVRAKDSRCRSCCRWWQKALLAFSVITNGRKILDTSQQAGRLNCLDGVRFLSMTWIILGHSYVFFVTYANSLLDFFQIVLRSWTYQVLMHADFSVDSFFLLSGLLTAYIFLKEASKLGTVASVKFWFLYYFHRYWRLTPAYMLFLGFFTTLMRYFSNGPLWSQAAGIEEEACKKYWWYNLLYINNFLPLRQSCMSWTWYLANDMQFHVFVATIIMPLMFYASRSKVVSFLAASSVFAFVLTSSLSISFISRALNLDNTVVGTNDSTYTQPWCRVGPYAMGLATGYLIRKGRNRKWRLHPIFVLSGWVLATLTCLSVIYGNSGVAAGLYRNSAAVNNLYLSASRVAWGLGLAWLLFACCTGYGGPVNSLLSWSAFVPLSRLTYMAYIVHPVVIYTFYGSLRQAAVPSTLLLVQMFLASLVTSYLAAFFFSLLWETPLIALEQVFRKK